MKDEEPPKDITTQFTEFKKRKTLEEREKALGYVVVGFREYEKRKEALYKVFGVYVRAMRAFHQYVHDNVFQPDGTAKNQLFYPYRLELDALADENGSGPIDFFEASDLDEAAFDFVTPNVCWAAALDYPVEGEIATHAPEYRDPYEYTPINVGLLTFRHVGLLTFRRA